MAYIPPHKRHSKDLERPSPTPEQLVPQFKRDLNLRSSQHNVERIGKIIYADEAVSRWFAVDLDDDSQFPSSVQLERILEPIDGKKGEKPLVLVNVAKENDEVKRSISRGTWESAAENIWPDLLSSFNIMSNKIESPELERVKPKLIVRFGKILFHGSNSVSLESNRGEQLSETVLRRLRRTFYTNVPTSYMENIMSEVVPKIGVDFTVNKDIYHVKVSDKARPNSIISCKCRVKEDKKFELYKIELNPVRHMVVDLSCLKKNLDIRLMLCSKKILSGLNDGEMHSIRNLIDSAVLDPRVKGGLRWPMGKSYSGDRYSVIGVWHTEVKSYENPSLRLNLRHADRFSFESASGEATIEITLKLKRIVSEIQERKVEVDSIYNMFKDNLGLIWDNFLCCERFLT